MSRALSDHKERPDRLIDQLTARVAHLEAGLVYKIASDRSTPPRHDRAQFFDICDHDSDIPRLADLLPVPGSLFPGRPGGTIPRSSLLGPIDHGSPSGCNAAPAEKASTVQSQTSCQNLDEILRRAKIRLSRSGMIVVVTIHDIISLDRSLNMLPKGLHRIDNSCRKCLWVDFQRAFDKHRAGIVNRSANAHNPELRTFAPEPRLAPTFPCQISYDTGAVPSGTGPSRWYNAMLGRSNFVSGSTGVPIVQSSTGTYTLAPSVPVVASLRPSAGDDGHPPIPTFNLRSSASPLLLLFARAA